MQGGIHPDLPGSFYFDLLDAVKARGAGDPHPRVQPDGGHERRHEARGLLPRSSSPRRRPTASARSPAPRPRSWTTTSGGCSRRASCPADTWEEIVRTAHGLGIRSSSTIMFGHVDAPPHWVAHIRRLARIQAERAGSRSSCRCRSSTRTRRSTSRARRVPAPRSRRTCGCTRSRGSCSTGLIPNIQVSWVKLGVEACQAILQGGANDFGGTLMEETISRMAGAEWGIGMEPDAVRRRDPRDRSHRPSCARRRTNASNARVSMAPLVGQSSLTFPSRGLTTDISCSKHLSPARTHGHDGVRTRDEAENSSAVSGLSARAFFPQNHTDVISGGD